jgi:hypothetical protein
MDRAKDIARMAQIALAIEPIPDKEGLTTRYVDCVDSLKLEYFIIGGINSGMHVQELMEREGKGTTYDILYKCIIDNHLNRGGMRVNGPILQFMWPILLAIKYFPEIDCPDTLLDKTPAIMKETTKEDALQYQILHNVGYEQWEGHKDKAYGQKLLQLHRESVYDVGYKDGKIREDIYGHPLEKLVWAEMLEGFRATGAMYYEWDQTKPYSVGMIDVYLWALDNLKGWPKGGIADLMAVVTFLGLYLEDYKVS